jgi:hypothetical protein
MEPLTGTDGFLMRAARWILNPENSEQHAIIRRHCAEQQSSCGRIDTLVNFAHYDNKTVCNKGVGTNQTILLLILLLCLRK